MSAPCPSQYWHIVTFVAGSIITVLCIYLTQARFNWLATKRDSTNRRNNIIEGYIKTIGSEIQRINSEVYNTTGAIGDTSTIEALLSIINATNPEISLSSQWKEYQANEHRRRYQEPNKKTNAIKALESMIHELQSYKT